MSTTTSGGGDLHARRLPPPLPDLALWDLVGTCGLALLSWQLTPRRWLSASLGEHVLFWFLASLAVHRALGIGTPLTCATSGLSPLLPFCQRFPPPWFHPSQLPMGS